MSYLLIEKKSTPKTLRSKNCQQGAVIVEFIVIAGFVLLPLFIGLLFIGKYIDTAQKVEVAARYSIWERTVWYQEVPKSLKKIGINTGKTPNQLNNELENRVFSEKNTGIYFKQNNDKVDETEEVMSESYWVDSSGKAISLYKHDAKRFITVVDGKKADMYGYSSGIMGGLFSLLGKVGGFDIDISGSMSSTVNLTLVKPQFLDTLWANDITVSRSQTILADGWNAAGPAQAKSRASGLVLTKALDFSAFNKVRDVVSILPMAKELKSSSLIFGHVAPDVVPESRLKIYTTK